jgi:hypothetical protein
MEEYHKIQTVYKRDQENNNKTLLEGQFSLPEFEYLQHNEWVFTEKVDGTNIRISQEEPGGKLRFKGRSDNSSIPATLVEHLNDTFLPMQALFASVFPGAQVCLYGEGYGPKIQKGGGNYRKDASFVLFDVNIGGWWLQRQDVVDIAHKLAVKVVPVLGRGSLLSMVEHARAGITSTWGDFQAEGYVARPATEMCTRNGHRMITKIKCKDFK